jgi:hypothetical protein
MAAESAAREDRRKKGRPRVHRINNPAEKFGQIHFAFMFVDHKN